MLGTLEHGSGPSATKSLTLTWHSRLIQMVFVHFYTSFRRFLNAESDFMTVCKQNGRERERETISLISFIYIISVYCAYEIVYRSLSTTRIHWFGPSEWFRQFTMDEDVGIWFCVSVPPQPPRCSSGRHNHPRQIPSVIYWRCFQCLKHTQTNTKTLAWRSFVALHLVYIASPLSPIRYCRSNI